MKQFTKINRFKRLGYRDFIELNGTATQLGNACKHQPIEVFKMIDKKKIIVAERIYKNLLDTIFAIDFQLYIKHRLSYQNRQIQKFDKRDKYELDYVVRNNLKDEKNIDTVSISLKGTNNFKKFQNLENSEEVKKSKFIVHLSKRNDYLKEFRIKKIKYKLNE